MSDSREQEARLETIKVARENYDKDAAPILDDLRAAGFEVASIGELYGRKLHYRDAIPVLVAWLPKIGNPLVKEEIVRALAVKWAANTGAATLLVGEFERADDPSLTGLRWAIGNALEVLASDAIGDDLIRLASDPRYGKAREMVVVGLGRLKGPRVTDVLLNLLADDEVVGHAVMALGKLRATAARARIEPLLNHSKPWVRKEAKRALARIDAAR